MKLTNLAWVCIVAATSCGTALAQKAGSMSASIGVTQISPSVTSGNLSAPSQPGVQVGLNSNSQLTAALNYMATDNIAVHLPLSFGFKHDVVGSGVLTGVGKLADTKVLPITLIGQYRFMDANAVFRPYLGAGVSYVKFYKTSGTGVLTALTNPGSAGTSLSFESKLAPTIQLGGVYNLTNQWYLEAAYSKTFLSTRGSVSTGQTIDVKVDPSAYSFQVGYKF